MRLGVQRRKTNNSGRAWLLVPWTWRLCLGTWGPWMMEQKGWEFKFCSSDGRQILCVCWKLSNVLLKAWWGVYGADQHKLPIKKIRWNSFKANWKSTEHFSLCNLRLLGLLGCDFLLQLLHMEKLKFNKN